MLLTLAAEQHPPPPFQIAACVGELKAKLEKRRQGATPCHTDEHQNPIEKCKPEQPAFANHMGHRKLLFLWYRQCHNTLHVATWL